MIVARPSEMPGEDRGYLTAERGAITLEMLCKFLLSEANSKAIEPGDVCP